MTTYNSREHGTYQSNGVFVYNDEWETGRFNSNDDFGRVYVNFDLPTFTQRPISARLIARDINIVTNDSFETLELWDSTASALDLGNFSPDIFNDLGSGKLYARANLDQGRSDRVIELNDDFLRDLAAKNGEEITIGGVLRGSLDSQVNDEYLTTFGTSESFVLEVTFGDNLVSIGDATVTEGNNGIKQANFTVSLDEASTTPITVRYSTANGTANAPSDYQAASGIVEFAPGQTRQTISVLVNGDTASELDESFSVNLSSVSGPAALGDAQGLGTIVNDDNTPVTFSVSDVTVTERDRGSTNGQIFVTRSGDTSTPVTVQYSLGNATASNRTDFSLRNGSLNFESGVTSLAIPFQIKGDSVAEATEDFSVRLTSREGIFVDNTGVVTINDNDRTNITINDINIREGSRGNTRAKLTVQLSNPSEEQIRIGYSLANGTAKANEDFRGRNGTIVVDPGQTRADLIIPVVADNKKEGNESFSVRLTGVTTSADARIQDSTGVVAIQDDDRTPTISFDQTRIRVREGNSGLRRINLPVSLSNPTQEVVEIRYRSVNGTARANQDFRPTSGTLRIQPGDTQGNIQVSVFGDFSVENNETFSVQLSNAENASLRSNRANITITNDDRRSRVSSFSFEENDIIGAKSAFPSYSIGSEELGSIISGESSQLKTETLQPLTMAAELLGFSFDQVVI